MSRILVTGCQGALGAPLVKELRSRGHRVFGCDLKHSSDENVMRADVSECRQIQEAFGHAQPDIVYALAGEFGRLNGKDFPEQMWKTNLVGTRNVIEECLRHNALLVFASSSEAYGEAGLYASDHEDFKEEWLDRYAPEFHNEYSLSKWANERQIFMSATNDKLRAIVLRFFNVYGPGELYTPYRSVICLFTYRLLAGLPITVYKNSFRTHLFIDDWTNCVANIATDTIREPIERRSETFLWPGSGRSRVPVFNIGGIEFESAESTMNCILRHVGESKSEITFLEAEKANIVSKKPDISLARHWLNLEPRMTMEAGISATVDWMRKVYSL